MLRIVHLLRKHRGQKIERNTTTFAKSDPLQATQDGQTAVNFENFLRRVNFHNSVYRKDFLTRKDELVLHTLYIVSHRFCREISTQRLSFVSDYVNVCCVLLSHCLP